MKIDKGNFWIFICNSTVASHSFQNHILLLVYFVFSVELILHLETIFRTIIVHMRVRVVFFFIVISTKC